MTLLRVVSERTDKHGKPFLDFYLAWRYEGKVYSVRVRPQFFSNQSMLHAIAIEVPQGETLEKYVD